MEKGLLVKRDPNLVEIASVAGVTAPSCSITNSSYSVDRPIPFIENKIYSFERIADLLSLSISQNHHANGGPVSRLLESMVAYLTRQPNDRKVIATSSGTSALHLACGLHAIKQKKPDFVWVTSAFNFFSASVGPLANTIVLDCSANGGFDLEQLKSLRLESFDGVVYTNVFAQHTQWKEVLAYCQEAGKSFVVDNATGLLDRPKSALSAGSPIEIISAHHTKPWGVGEGGFLICDDDDEGQLRKLANFGAGLEDYVKFAASNYKLSDLSAAAIIDRLECMPFWGPNYNEQQERLHSLLINTNLNIQLYCGETDPLSPRAHTPFLSALPINFNRMPPSFILRKYYLPLASRVPTPNAIDIYSRIFSLSNSPEMRQISDDEILTQLSSIIE